MIQTIITNGGKDEKDTDRNNCFVRALAIVLDRPYYEMYDLMKELGRKDKKGTPYKIMLQAALHLGLEVSEYYKDRTHPWFGKTVSRWAEQEPGSFITCSRTHAKAIKNHVIYDTFASGTKQKVFIVIRVPKELDLEKTKVAG